MFLVPGIWNPEWCRRPNRVACEKSPDSELSIEAHCPPNTRSAVKDSPQAIAELSHREGLGQCVVEAGGA